jgi:hypothetical protein
VDLGKSLFLIIGTAHFKKRDSKNSIDLVLNAVFDEY